VRRIFLKLEEPLNLAYAIGALAGLRTGEVFALRWTSVDLAGRRILVSESIGGLTKDREPRPVSIQDALLPLLKAWHVKTGGTGLVIPPMRQDGAHIDKSTPAQHLRHALVALKLPPLEPKPWYQATRHTFASHWAMAGRPASYSHPRAREHHRHRAVRPSRARVLGGGRSRCARHRPVARRQASFRGEFPEDSQTARQGVMATKRNNKVKCRSRPVSRVLSRRKSGGGEHSSRTRVAARLQRAVPGGPDRVSLPPARRRCTRGCGRPPYLLLHRVGFSVPVRLPGPRCALAAPFHPCHARLSAPFGGLFSVALSCGSPRPAVSRHSTLRCPDFPRRPSRADAFARTTPAAWM